MAPPRVPTGMALSLLTVVKVRVDAVAYLER